MANTVTNIDLTNTFGEWVATTTQLVNEYNILATDDWSKSSGDFIIETANAAFIVQNGSTATFQVPVEISGASANLVVRSLANFQELTTFSNTVTSFTASGNVSLAKNLVVAGNVTGDYGIFNNIGGQALDAVYNTIDQNAISANSVISSSVSSLTSYIDNQDSNLSSSIVTANNNMRLYVNSNISANVTTLNNTINTANTNLKLYTDSNITANAVSANAVISKANTDLKLYTDSRISANASSLQTQINDLVKAKGFITFNPSTGSVFSAANLTVIRNGAGVYTVTLASGIRDGTTNYAAVVGAIDSGNYRSESSGSGAMDIRTIGIDTYSSSSFVVRSIRRYNSGLVQGGGNDANSIPVYTGEGVDPLRITVVVF